MTRGPAADGPLVAVVATEDTAERWTEQLVAAGLASRPVPFAVAVPPPDLAALQAAADATYDRVIATSRSAFRFLAVASGRGRPAAAVGSATARAMQRIGFDVDVTGAAGAEALARRLAEQLPPARVLWLRGARANEAGAAVLRAAGWSVDEVVAYATAPSPGFSAAVADLASRRVVWVFGSGAAAEAWLHVVEGAAVGRGPCVAVGPTAAAPLRAAGIADVTVARAAAPDALVETVLEVLRRAPS